MPSRDRTRSPAPRPSRGLSVADALRKAVRESDLNDSALAELAGVHRGVPGRFLRDEHAPSLATAEALAHALGGRLVYEGRDASRRRRPEMPSPEASAA